MTRNEGMLEKVWGLLRNDIRAQAARVTNLTLLTQRSETSGAFPPFAYADAPRASTGAVTDGDCIWISDGRKSGEGAGNGTGVPCYYVSAVDDYYTFRTDALVTI